MLTLGKRSTYLCDDFLSRICEVKLVIPKVQSRVILVINFKKRIGFGGRDWDWDTIMIRCCEKVL